MTTINPKINIEQLNQIDSNIIYKTDSPNSVLQGALEASNNVSHEEICETLTDALKTSDDNKLLETLNKIINANDSDLIGAIIKEYSEKNNKSLAFTLFNHPVIKENADIYKKIKEICIPQTNGFNDFLAVDLFYALNGSNLIKSKNLILNKIKPINVTNVAYFYDKIALETGEVVGTKSEIEYLHPKIESFWDAIEYFFTRIRYPDVKINAEHPEKLIQGILNQEQIDIKERKKLLKHVLLCYEGNARIKNIDESKIKEFHNTVFVEKSKKWDKTIFEHVTSYPDNKKSQSTYEIECALTKLFEGVR